MNFLLPTTVSPKNQIQTRLIILAVAFVFLGSVALTLAPAVRVHSWIAEYRWQHWLGFAVWLIGFLILINQLNRYLPDRDPYLTPHPRLVDRLGTSDNLSTGTVLWVSADSMAGSLYCRSNCCTYVFQTCFSYYAAINISGCHSEFYSLYLLSSLALIREEVDQGCGWVLEGFTCSPLKL